MPKALPVNVCAGTVPAVPVKVSAGMVEVAFVGTPAGQETVGCVNEPAAIVGTPAGQAFVPAGVIELTAPAGAGIEPPKVTGAVPVEPVEPIPDADVSVVPAEPLVGIVPVKLVIAWVWVITPLKGVPEKAGTPTGHAIAPSANAPLALVGTPAGHEITCAGPVTVPLVPAGVPALTASLLPRPLCLPEFRRYQMR